MQSCIWPSWCHCHSLSLASVKSRLVLPFWYRLTQVVLDKGPLNGSLSLSVFVDGVTMLCELMVWFIEYLAQHDSVSAFALSLSPMKHCMLVTFRLFGICRFVYRNLFVSEFIAKDGYSKYVTNNSKNYTNWHYYMHFFHIQGIKTITA